MWPKSMVSRYDWYYALYELTPTPPIDYQCLCVAQRIFYPTQQYCGLADSNVLCWLLQGSRPLWYLRWRWLVWLLSLLSVCLLTFQIGTTCLGCDGKVNSGLVLDPCGVCGGTGSTCCLLHTLHVIPLVAPNGGADSVLQIAVCTSPFSLVLSC